LLTGQRPPPLWVRVLAYLGIPALFIVAMNYFTVDATVEKMDGSGEKETVKIASPGVIWSFIVYVILLIGYGYVKNKNTRGEILVKLYTERAEERGEDVDPQQLRLYLRRNDCDNIRAHCCCAFCYQHDEDFYDEAVGMIRRDGVEEDEQPERDFCTCLWDCLSRTFWCCGCWCQCCGICAVAQEEREVNRLTGNEEQKIDYLTFQPHSEYYASIHNLTEHRIRSPWKHLQSISILSSKLLKNVAAVLVILIIYALLDIDSNFTWENMIVLLLTLGQAFFIEYLVHWNWNLFDLSFDSVIKYFACGFFLTTPSAVVAELVISTVATAIAFIVGILVMLSDSQLANDFESDPKLAMKEFMVKYPALLILFEFVNAFAVAALVEEIVKYFGYRMVVTPDLLPGRPAPSSRNLSNGEAEAVDGSNAKSVKSTGAGITVAMVSVALGFACCENLMYVFVYSPPSIDVEISTLVARSLFPVHPLCAAIQSIGVCRRDLEGDKQFGLGRIIFPAILLHGSFDFVLMVAAYFSQADKIKEGADDDAIATPENEQDATADDILEQLPAMILGFVFVLIGYTYYVVQSRAQTQRLIAMDIAHVREQNSSLV